MKFSWWFIASSSGHTNTRPSNFILSNFSCLNKLCWDNEISKGFSEMSLSMCFKLKWIFSQMWMKSDDSVSLLMSLHYTRDTGPACDWSVAGELGCDWLGPGWWRTGSVTTSQLSSAVITVTSTGVTLRDWDPLHWQPEPSRTSYLRLPLNFNFSPWNISPAMYQNRHCTMHLSVSWILIVPSSCEYVSVIPCCSILFALFLRWWQNLSPGVRTGAGD